MMNPKNSPTNTSRALLFLCVLTAATLPACNYIGAAAVVLSGPPMVDAKAEIPDGKSVVFFIDDAANKLQSTRIRDQISSGIDREILKKDVVEDLVASRSATLASRSGAAPGTEMLSIIEVGQAVDAGIIIWITIDDFSLSPDGINFIPSTTVRLKMFDTESGDQLWPTEDVRGGVRFTFAIPQEQGTAPRTRSQQRQAELALADYAGIAIAQLFYEHEKIFSHVEP